MAQGATIIVLDGYALNPGDLSWDAVCHLAPTVVYDRTPVEQIVERAKAAELVLTNKVPLDSSVLDRLPALRYIGVMATGYDIVDVAAASSRHIVVTNVPAYGTDSVAQMTFALLLELCNQVGRHAEAVRNGQWSRSPDWSFTCSPLVELAGKTMGIVGYGRIGQRVGQLARAFGMQVVATGGKPKPGVEWMDLDPLLQCADVVSLHCPLTASTRHLIQQRTLALLKSSAFLLNTSRGGLVADADLAAALRDERLAGAGLDVLTLEPPVQGSPLLGAPRCLITPHVAWATQEARARLLRIVTDNVHAYLNGCPQNVVSLAAGASPGEAITDGQASPADCLDDSPLRNNPD